MATIAQLIVDVAANTVKLQTDVEKINKSLTNVEDIAGKVGKALAGAFTIASAGAATKQLLDFADNIVNVSEKTKFSTDAVQELTLAFQPHGIALDAVATANEKLSKNLIGDDKSTVAALQKMGLNVQKLKTLEPEKLFITVADAVGKIKNPAEQAYVAMTVFGKGGSELLAGLDGHLKETTESFKAMGLIIDEKTIKAADDFGDQLGLMGKQVLGLVGTIVGPLLPALSALASILTWLGQHVIGPVLNVVIKLAITLLGEFYTVIADVLGGLLSLAAKLPGGVGKKFAEMADAVKNSSSSTTAYINGLWKETDHVAASTTKTHGPLQGFGGDLEEAARKAKEFKEAMEKYVSIGGSYIKTVNGMSGATVDGIRYDLARGQSQEVLQKIYGVTAEQIKAIIEVTRLEEEIDKNRVTIAKAAAEAFVTRLQAQADALHLWQDAYLENMQVEKSLQTEHADFVRKTTLTAFQYQRAQLADWINDQEGQLDYSQENWSAAYAQIHIVARDRLREIVQNEQQAFDEMKGQESTWANGLAKLLGGVPQLLQQALTGGGGFGGFGKAMVSGLGALAGDQLLTSPLTSLFNSAAPALSNTLGHTLTTAIGGAIPFIGPAIGALAGPLISGIKKLFGGPSEDELAARDTFAKFQKQYGTLEQTIIGVGAAYAKMGKTGIEAQQDLRRALDATHISAEAEAAALDVINGKLNEGLRDQQDLTDAITRYKFSIEELGPAMQKQQLDAQAKQLLNDWRLLVESGISVTAVNDHMSASMNDYLKLARTTGQEVPTAMQPILQKMIDQGLLTDDAGNKIADLQGIGVAFSMTMTEGFKSIVDKLQELLDKIGLVPAAIATIPTNISINASINLPSSVDVAVNYIPGDMPDYGGNPYGSSGGLVTAGGVQHFATGGVVLPFVPRGTDTVPAMLTPGEMVLTQRQQGALGLSGGGNQADWRELVTHIKASRASQERAERYMLTQASRDQARAVKAALQTVISR